MVESPRIRIIYENSRFTKNHKIINASGATYRKINVNLIGYTIRKWWYAGKYIYVYLIKDNEDNKKLSSIYVIRTHTMMYGRIIVNDIPAVNPRLRHFLRLELDDGTTLTWYLTQIKLLDPKCKTDVLKSNYTICSSYEALKDSIRLMQYDISNPNFNINKLMDHLKAGAILNADDIVVDFLLNQEYFPGVGNILQQESLYRCKILPTRLISQLSNTDIVCLVSKLQEIINQLYESFIKAPVGLSHAPILQIYHKGYCPLGHKTVTKILAKRERRTTWCPICQI